MHCWWPKAFAAGSADRVGFHDSERTGDGRSLYRAHENLSCGSSGGGFVLCIFSRLSPHLRANSILEEKAWLTQTFVLGAGLLALYLVMLAVSVIGSKL